MYTEIIFEKGTKNIDTIEVCFGYSAFGLLHQSEFKEHHLCGIFTDFSLGKIEEKNFGLSLDSSKKIRIFSSRKNVQEYLNFLAICHQFKKNAISVIFVDEYKEELYSLGTMTKREFIEVLKQEKGLTEKEKNEFSKEWLYLKQQNSELRIFDNKKIKGVPYSYIFPYIEKHYCKDSDRKTIANLMAYDEENNYSDETWQILLEIWAQKR